MYEQSREYLSRLISESGIKIGTAKHHAMVAIIELLDENSMGGLIKAIKGDYEEMVTLVKQKEDVVTTYRGFSGCITEMQGKLRVLEKQIKDAKAELKALEEQKHEAELSIVIDGCRDEEKSRLLAYKAAIDIGKENFQGRISDDSMTQILRSASNVAANWVHAKAEANEPSSWVRKGKPIAEF